FAGNRSSNSLPYVDRLLRAGAILLGRSTSPEFGLLCVCHSPLWGVTRNPWNLEYSPGGSSGGAGAALAAGMTTIADGSDYGGSIRVPASASGVFGIKPSYGRVPAGTVESLDPYHAYGPMTRTVADGALMLNVMAGQHHSDPASVPGRFRLPLKPKDIKGWRVALSMDLGYFEIDSEVVSNTLAAADAFRELGCTVDEVTIPWTKDIFEAAATHYAAYLYYEDPEQMDPEKGALLADSTLAYTAKSAARHRLSFEQAQQVRARMYADLEKIFRRYRVMLCPMLGITGVPADLPVEGVDVYINGKKQDPEWDWCLAYPFNMLGYLPIASVPSGFSSQKMPTGLQIVGQPFDEVSVFRAAYAFERVRPWMDCPERRPPL
ncbi:MAG: amidase, partial [Gammaproteobacteria bacterium]|nr:amidase [Gammaproteobacteria bacterium]